MATTQVTTDAFVTAIAECADAVEAGDRALALRKLAKAEVINAGLDLKVTVLGAPQNAVVERRATLDKTRAMLESTFSGGGAAADNRRIVTGRTNFS